MREESARTLAVSEPPLAFGEVSRTERYRWLLSRALQAENESLRLAVFVWAVADSSDSARLLWYLHLGRKYGFASVCIRQDRIRPESPAEQRLGHEIQKNWRVPALPVLLAAYWENDAKERNARFFL